METGKAILNTARSAGEMAAAGPVWLKAAHPTTPTLDYLQKFG
jgi:hypothetical protein